MILLTGSFKSIDLKIVEISLRRSFQGCFFDTGGMKKRFPEGKCWLCPAHPWHSCSPAFFAWSQNVWDEKRMLRREHVRGDELF